MTEAMRPYLDRLQSRALVIGVIGLVATAAGFFLNSEQFFRSYLLGFMYWVGVALGSLGLLMLHHMVGGGWGVAIRRGLEAGTRTFPLLAILFLPLAFGVHSLYEWSHADVVAKDTILQHKSLYLNQTGFYIRAVMYFLIWGFLAMRLNKMSEDQERQGYWAIRPRLQRLSAPGLILHTLAVTFATVDWVMSLEPHWFSTIHGAIFLVNQALSTFAVMIFIVCLLSTKDPMKGTVKTQTYHDLGTLMFAFNMLWAYVSFSQFLIMWSANLPEEISWYVRRLRGGWEWVGLAVFLFHFCLVFILLLMRKIKRNPSTLQKVAMWVIFMRLVDLIWMIHPAFTHNQGGVPAPHLNLHWLDLAAPIGIGGLWIAFFAFQMKQRSIEPMPVS